MAQAKERTNMTANDIPNIQDINFEINIASSQWKRGHESSAEYMLKRARNMWPWSNKEFACYATDVMYAPKALVYRVFN
jgi:hypothetical protein